MISVVMASYLGEYKLAAKNREKKILRAVESALNQTIQCELVVVSDGCQKTIDILNEHFEGKFNGYTIPKQNIWSGVPRNTGIEKAKNEIICYLDVDDYLIPTHCEFILNKFGDNDWVWFDDWVFSKTSGWKIRSCSVAKRGFCGTSNLAHKKINIWPDKGNYAHDWIVVQNLQRWSSKYKYIGHGGYRVAHVPGRVDI